MENIENVAKSVLLMDKQLREELLVKDGKVQNKKLWEHTHIKKQIDRRKSGDTFTVTDHIRAMVYSMLTSGAPWNRLEPYIDIETGRIWIIDEIFYQYDVDKLLSTDPSELVGQITAQTLGAPYIKNQMNALINANIENLLALEKEYGSTDNFYQSIINTDSTMKTLVKELSAAGKPHKFAQLGEALTAEYLRNVGYDIAKPDRHICRILGSDILGCSDKKVVPIYEAFDIVAAIANALEKDTAEVDYILWSYCASGYGEICTLKNPKCQYCVAKQICKFTE